MCCYNKNVQLCSFFWVRLRTFRTTLIYINSIHFLATGLLNWDNRVLMWDLDFYEFTCWENFQEPPHFAEDLRDLIEEKRLLKRCPCDILYVNILSYSRIKKKKRILKSPWKIEILIQYILNNPYSYNSQIIPAKKFLFDRSSKRNFFAGIIWLFFFLAGIIYNWIVLAGIIYNWIVLAGIIYNWIVLNRNVFDKLCTYAKLNCFK